MRNESELLPIVRPAGSNLPTVESGQNFAWPAVAAAPNLAASDVLDDKNLRATAVRFIDDYWQKLIRVELKSRGSLLGLPKPYVVPGGRFDEGYYWDSFFIMLGLTRADKWDLIRDIIDDLAFTLKKYGLIPTANRTYYLGRSQPPLLSWMVKLLAEKFGDPMLLKYLPALIREHNFWMKGVERLNEPGAARRRVVKVEGGILNRYWADRRGPRFEQKSRDRQTAANVRRPNRLFTNLRAGAESGWDFSSRWLDDDCELASIRTADILPVDLNCLLYDLEKTIATGFRKLGQTENSDEFFQKAAARRDLIQRYFWHSADGFYYDYDFVRKNQTGRKTLAALFPLRSKISDKDQAGKVAARIGREFLATGGLKTTLRATAQQWDAPNGWAPLNWIAVGALQNYGHSALAGEIKARWIRTCLSCFARTGKFYEKYNVVRPEIPATGGEYPLQTGFGWTNGVLRDLLDGPFGPRLKNYAEAEAHYLKASSKALLKIMSKMGTSTMR
ncbi:MAG: hypothetical protein LBM73_02790, partial [Candidatus Nomurabacteria bacterium]|nr:hypothetical protein [Candidatus Nomurabacteria bacterium]